MSGNLENKFHLNEVTGELTIRGRLGKKRDSRGLSVLDKEGLKNEEKNLKRRVGGEKKEVEDSEWGAEQKRGRGEKSQRQDDYSYEDDEFAPRSNNENVIDSVIVLNIRAYDLGKFFKKFFVSWMFQVPRLK